MENKMDDLLQLLLKSNTPYDFSKVKHCFDNGDTKMYRFVLMGKGNMCITVKRFRFEMDDEGYITLTDEIAKGAPVLIKDTDIEKIVNKFKEC